MKTRFASFFLALLVSFPPLLRADNEIGFIEKFALAPDREQVLGQLIPGSEEYYFFHALHYQNSGQAEKLKSILQQWAARFPNSAQRRIIENREAILTYDTDPKALTALLRARLNLQFNHQQEARDHKPDLPVTLDPARISHEAFRAEAISHSPQDLRELGDEALIDLVRSKTKLTPPQRRALLSRLSQPDLPGLVDIVAEDLDSKESKGFGEYPIHHLLLPEQLDDLAKRIPALYENQAFVRARLHQLLPGADADVQFDPAEHEAWLNRLWAYAKNLSPSFNSLKAGILFQRLVFDRSRGVYDKARFLEYLKLPRNAQYVSPAYLKKAEQNVPAVDFGADFSEFLIAPPIRDDEWLVRDYLLRLFKEEASWEPYAVILRDSYVKPLFAEAKIVNGVGDPEQWAALLSPAAFQALKDRVDLDFAPANAQLFAPKDEVSLGLSVKNIPKLIVRIYELNTLTFFLTQGRQLNTDLNLDGLVANVERTHAFDDAAGQSPFRRTARTFEFPELKGKRGAWIVEFIGGGKSSRALIRKGQWELLAATGPAGDMVTVVDEAHQPVPDAVAWLEGRRYTPDEKTGRIVVPFTHQPGTKPIVLASPSGDFASLTTFEHHGEQYHLDAQFHLEREQLLAGRQATLAIRTALVLGAALLPTELITEPKLTITSKTLDGVVTTREINAAQGLKLEAGRLALHSFPVPDRLAELTAALTGQVENLSEGGTKVDLSAARTWLINGIDKTDATFDGHFTRTAAGCFLDLLGKDGEAVADQQVVFQFHRSDFTNNLSIALRTDEHGRITLGSLAGLASVEVQLANGQVRQWPLQTDAADRPAELHGRAGETLFVPWLGGAGPLRPEEVSLLEKRGDSFVADRFAALSVAGGLLQIKGLAPGDYQLRLRDPGEQTIIQVKVTTGAAIGDWLVSDSRNLQVRDPAPLQIETVQPADDFITVQLRNANPFTTVQVVADRFTPASSWQIGPTLGGFERFSPTEASPARRPALYVSGRAIGDEYRYIIERRYTKIYPGNMLTRPGLLLNPWELRTTDLAEQSLQQAEGLERGRGDREAKAAATPMALRRSMNGDKDKAPYAANPDLDFFFAPAPALYNLVPDQNGVVRIDRKALGDRQFVQICAEDLQGAVWRSVALPEVQTKFRDLRLARNLDPQKAFAESKQVSVLAAGQTVTLADLLSADLETYESLAGVHALLSALSHNAELAKFAFILDWPKLKDEEKRAKYSEFACHELNFFLSRKDPAFFEHVVQPYLRNKKDKTFMDEYLLGSDLHRFLQPWSYGRLNVAERALLARRLPDETAATARHLHELWELAPPNLDQEDLFFETALGGKALSEGKDGAFQDERRKRVESEQEAFGRAVLAPAAGLVASAAVGPAAPAPAASPLGGAVRLGGGRGGKAVTEALTDLAAGDVTTRTLSKAQERSAAMFGDVPVEWNANKRGFGLGLASDALSAAAQRSAVRQFFRKIGPTKEWAENNYYQLPIAAQEAGLIPVNGFWLDFAQWDGKSPFLSPHVAEASRNFSEMMLALALLDLPFDAPKNQTRTDNGQFTLTAGGPLLAFHKEIVPVAPAGGQTELLVSENFFRHDDRYRTEGNERFDKYVTDEFLTGVVYGANVVVTNPASSPQKIELLLQIPQGALPVLGSKATDSKRLRLDPYTTKTLEYAFYFPATGPQPFAHYPAHVSHNGAALGGAKPTTFQVVRQLSKVDETSWDYISQYGTEPQVFAFLEKANLAQLDLTRIAWRARQSAAFLDKIVALLAQRHVYDDTLYSYAVYHNDRTPLAEWLRHHDEFLNDCGPYLDSTLLRIDPIERRAYQHLEYTPLINQRIHRLGAENRIANPVFRAQYQGLLNILAHKPALDAMDQMSVVYYLFLQDRVEEALARFKGIQAEALPTRLQYDYFRCYAAFYTEQLADARGVASQYAAYPVDRWQKLFAGVLAQLDEIEGKGVAPAAPKNPGEKPDREVQQAELASTEPSFDLKVEDHHLTLTWKNLTAVTINYYLMDPEFLFSSSPFVTQDPGRFSIIKPSKSVPQALPAGTDTLDVPLPKEFERANVLIEVLGAGQRHAEAYHANTLKLNLVENYGRLDLRDSIEGKPVSKAYVKVYARLKNGGIRFYKDGYTDLRGKFDYASLNAGNDSGEATSVPQGESAPGAGFDYQMLRPRDLGEVERLSILVLSETHGAIVREVNPPSE